MTSQEDPYPANSFFAVHKGYKAGVYTTFAQLQSQTRGYLDGKSAVFAVFSDGKHAEVFVKTGESPPGVEPLVPKQPGRRLGEGPPFVAGPSTSSRSTAPSKPRIVAPATTVADTKPSTSRTFPRNPAPLPTPSVSPDRSLATPFVSASQPSRTQTHDTSSSRSYASQPTRSDAIPVTPQKSIKPEENDMDEGGDTEPEEDDRPLPPMISHARTSAATPPHSGPIRQTKSAITPGFKPAPLGRTLTRGSIAEVLRRQASAGTVFPHATTDTSGPDTVTAGPPSKPTPKPPTRETVAHNPTTLSTPDPTPVARANLKRMRECTHCNGTGQVPRDDDESDSSRTDMKPMVFKRSTGSPTLERRPKRLSDGKRYEARDAKTKVDVDKGKGRACDTDRIASVPRTSFAREYL
ncbi:hypothetical protein FRC12_019689 [Ceratobasidium sp. 428]|nr:hypothetical protein FRC12_019689 [Ceratobasidium sp. 428]